MARKLGNVTTRSFEAGEVIFREGDDPRDEAFMIHAGRVEVRKRVGREQRLLRVLVRGELLGELLRRRPRRSEGTDQQNAGSPKGLT